VLQVPHQPLVRVALVHQPLTDPHGQVAAFALRDMPHQARRDLTSDGGLDAAYQDADLVCLAADRPLLLQATRRVLVGEEEFVVADLPAEQAQLGQVQPIVAWRHAHALRTSVSGFTGTEAEVVLLPKLTMVAIGADVGDNQLGHLIDLAHSMGVMVVAQRVRTAAEHRRAFDLGVDLVEGRAMPDGELEQGGLSAGDISCLELLGMLAEEPVDYEAITGLVACDPNLAVGVLHLVNSAVFALPAPVESVRQAVVMVGPRLLRALAATSLNQARRADTDELWHVLAQALACWELSEDDTGYTVGLLSAVIDQRGVDPAWLAGMAGLSPAATDALVSLGGPVGAALEALRAHEHGDAQVALDHGMDPHVVSRAWLEALTEARGIATALTTDP